MHLQIESDLQQTQEKGRRLVTELETIATKLNKVRFGSNVGKVAGSSAAIAGTVVSVTGGILSFFTFGASLILVIVGASVAAAGGFAATGAFVADKVISKKKLRQVQTLYEGYLSDPYVAGMLATDHISNEGSTHTTDGPRSAAKDGASIFLAAGRVVRVADFIADTTSPALSAVRVATTAGRALVITGLVVDSILLPLTVYDLVTSSLELHRKKGHPAGEGVRNCIDLIKIIDQDITCYTTLPIDSTNDQKVPGGLKNANGSGFFRFL